jgi:hypothetical protein
MARIAGEKYLGVLEYISVIEIEKPFDLPSAAHATHSVSPFFRREAKRPAKPLGAARIAGVARRH